MCELLITRSFETIVWLRQKGVKFQASFGRQSHKIGNKFKFWGGLAAETWGGGPGLVENEHKACARDGIKIFYERPAVALLTDDNGAVCGVKVKRRENR